MNARRGRDEAGAYLILYALLAVGFFTMAAIVLDLASLRQGRRADRTATDLAATAAVTELDVNDPASFARACQAAWGYVLANKSDIPGAASASAPNCAGVFPSSQACTSALGARTAVGTVGPLRVEITSPVPDSSPLMLAEAQGGDIAQPVNPSTDGSSCTRVGVRIVRSKTFLFGGIAGLAGGSTDVHSVARALTTTSTSEIPGVLALEPSGCDAVSTDAGGGQLRVAGVGLPGVVLADSDGSSCAGGYTIDPRAPGSIAASPDGAAAGVIASYALSGSNFASAYDPADVGAGVLSPQPTPALRRTGRGVIDSRYNCNGGSCPAGSDHVDQLRARYGGPGAPVGLAPYAGPCSVGVGMGGTFAGPMFVDCPVFEVLDPVTFSGGDVVFSGDVVVRDGGCLAFNSPFCGAAGVGGADTVVYVRGSLSKPSDAVLLLNQAFLYAGGTIDLPVAPNPGAGSSVFWRAPLAGPFEDLLAWTDSPTGVLLGGQDLVVLEGTLFAPNATVVIQPYDCGAGGGGGCGGGGGVGASFDVALQVVAGRVALHGTGNATLSPSASRATGRLTRQVRLLR